MLSNNDGLLFGFTCVTDSESKATAGYHAVVKCDQYIISMASLASAAT